MAVNVNRENPDQFYRYKMPLLMAKVVDFHCMVGWGSCGLSGTLCVGRRQRKWHQDCDSQYGGSWEGPRETSFM